jgi:hypothetical protein
MSEEAEYTPSPEFLKLKEGFGEIEKLAEASFKGDKEAKNKLNNSTIIKDLKTKVDKQRDQTPINGLFGIESMELMDLSWKLDAANNTPCFEAIRDVVDLKEVPVTGWVLEESGSKYSLFVEESDGSEYGMAVEEALSNLEDNKIGTLFNGFQAFKKDVKTYIVTKYQGASFNRTFPELIKNLDLMNGMAVRASTSCPPTIEELSKHLREYTIPDIVADLEDFLYVHSVNNSFDLPLGIKKLIDKIKAYHFPEEPKEQNDTTIQEAK